MGSEVMWPLVCLVSGLLLIVAEVFIPSGGLLGILSTCLLVLSLVLAFSHSMALGVGFLLALSVFVPAALGLALKIWPHTPVGKWMFLRPPCEGEIERAPGMVTGGTRLEHLIGREGRALTPLRPSGLVEIDGRRVDALSEEGLIAAGSVVRAVVLRSGRVVVRSAPEELTLEDLVGDETSA